MRSSRRRRLKAQQRQTDGGSLKRSLQSLFPAADSPGVMKRKSPAQRVRKSKGVKKFYC